MASDKDVLGDQLEKKERAEEDLYFKERDQALLERLRKEKSAPAPDAALLRCPKDGTALVPFELVGVTVEECPTCKGMWLDRGEFETIAQHERDSWLGRLFYTPRR